MAKGRKNSKRVEMPVRVSIQVDGEAGSGKDLILKRVQDSLTKEGLTVVADRNGHGLHVEGRVDPSLELDKEYDEFKKRSEREWTPAEKEILDMAGQADEKFRELMAKSFRLSSNDPSVLFIKVLLQWLFEKMTAPHFEAVIGKGGRITIPEPTRIRHSIKEGSIVTVTLVSAGTVEMLNGVIDLAKDGKVEDTVDYLVEEAHKQRKR